MKLGILVVYVVSAGNEWVLDKHLQHLSQTSAFMDFTVYAAVNRLHDDHRALLTHYDFVKVVDLPTVMYRSSAEHGTYLDLLAAHAIADKCDYICTFDVDSWPIRDDWIQIIYNLLCANGAAGAAILRVENGDSILPHPSFSFFEAGLFEGKDCRYWIPELERSEDLYRYLALNEQFYDTGAAIGFHVSNMEREWIGITRSNVRDYHYLMGGIYGDIIFHLGASSRSDMIFRNDGETWVTRVTRPMSSAPVLWKYKGAVQKLLNACYEPPACRRNRRAFNAIARLVRNDEQAFYRELRGDNTRVAPETELVGPDLCANKKIEMDSSTSTAK